MFQVHIVIEFQREQVHIGQCLGQLIIPGAEIGNIAHGHGLVEEVGGGLEAEAECRAAVVAERKWPATQTRTRLNSSPAS